MDKILLVALGGALGATLRFLLSTFFLQNFLAKNGSFLMLFTPTMLINILGCFCIGFLFFYLKDEGHLKLFLIVGILGGFTTFSSFGMEFLNLILHQKFTFAILYVFLTNILGLLAVFLGSFVAKIAE
ncbi:fluoride efflux transporter FluC [Helicobacter burdigaliensis]|uniref:fluoride efflux transporter FluC n=1 Tax=Helicobacter burdigaliensis TaxID=2315334 RepID=UPI000EF73C8B|nr:CrcB family protein [Helicobacter burdigaliensis]